MLRVLEPTGSRPAPRAGRVALLLGTAAATVALVRGAHGVRGGPGMLLAILGMAGALWLARLERRDPRLPIVAIVSTIAVLVVVSLATPPHGSTDMWSYLMYGRVLAVHHASPYLRAPAHYPSDPFLQRVSTGWRSTRCVYGPVFVAFAALVARVAGNSALTARLLFQGADAVAVIGAIVIAARVTRSRSTVVWLGLQPVVWLSGVSGGHNDALVGVAVLGATVLAARRRVALAGAVLAAAALVKMTALLALLGLVPWVFTTSGRKEAARLLGVGLGTVAAATLLVPASLRVLASSDHRVSRASAWNVARRWLLPGLSGHAGASSSDLAIAAGALTVVVLACALGLAFRHRPDPFPGTAAATTAYSTAGPYVLPWYAMWSLPTLATNDRRAFASIAAAGYGLLLAAYQLPQSHAHSPWDPLLRGLVTVATPLPMAVAFAVTAFLAARGPRRGDRTLESASSPS